MDSFKDSEAEIVAAAIEGYFEEHRQRKLAEAFASEESDKRFTTAEAEKLAQSRTALARVVNFIRLRR